MAESNTLRVDVDKVLADKNPRLARLLPRFVTAYLKRIVHQDEVNFILESYSHLDPIKFIRATLRHMEISYTSHNIGKLPRSGRYLFASNHPFGGMDGMMLCDELYTYFGETLIIVNDILMNLRPINPLFIPVNKHGRQNSEYARNFKTAMASDVQIATFPAGLCSRRLNGEVRDLKWKSSFVKNAIESRRDIVPVYFDGELSSFFYNLSRIRTMLGIKANIEMLYLVDEMFRQQGRHFNIVFGDPVPWQKLSEDKTPTEWSHEIKRRVYELKKTL